MASVKGEEYLDHWRGGFFHPQEGLWVIQRVVLVFAWRDRTAVILCHDSKNRAGFRPCRLAVHM